MNSTRFDSKTMLQKVNQAISYHTWRTKKAASSAITHFTNAYLSYFQNITASTQVNSSRSQAYDDSLLLTSPGSSLLTALKVIFAVCYFYHVSLQLQETSNQRQGRAQVSPSKRIFINNIINRSKHHQPKASSCIIITLQITGSKWIQVCSTSRSPFINLLSSPKFDVRMIT